LRSTRAPSRKGGRRSHVAEPPVGDVEYRAVRVFFTEDAIGVQLADGREVRTPLEYYPRLKKATPAQQMNLEIIGLGTGIHWPDLDEDLSVEGIALGRPAVR
jgi:hypothetical protein